jgi:hypothetical protein
MIEQLKNDLKFVENINKDQWEKLIKNQNIPNKNLFHSGAKRWMWDYCFYVGSYEYEDTYITDGIEYTNHYKYDLGIFMNFFDKHPNLASAAHVYSNKRGCYNSGVYDLESLKRYYNNEHFQYNKKGWELFIEKLKTVKWD